MYIIIAGCRKVGSNLAIALARNNHDVVVVDSDAANFELLGTGFNGLTVTGIPIDEDVLVSAGIEKANALAAVTNNDNMNVMVSQVARDIFHVPKVITRITDPERDQVFKAMGLHTICPTTLAVDQLKEQLTSNGRYFCYGLDGSDIVFKYVTPTKKAMGRALSSFMNESVFGVVRNGSLILSRPGLRILEGDLMVVAEHAGKDDDFE